MVSKCLKTFLVIREMQVETTLRYHFIPTRMANIRKTVTDVWRWRQ